MNKTKAFICGISILLFIMHKGQAQNLAIREHTTITTLSLTTDWTIDKTVSPDKWDLFVGDTGKSDFTIDLNKTVSETWAVSGSFIVENIDDEESLNITEITVDIGGTMAQVDLMGPIDLEAGNMITIEYSADMLDGTTQTSIITVNGMEFNDMASTSEVSFDPADETNNMGEPGMITVFDDQQQQNFGPFSDDDQIQYERTFACNEDEGVNNNVATINETGDEDDASVQINCYDITVEKTVEASFTREWDWGITKRATNEAGEDVTELTLPLDQISSDSWWEIVVDTVGHTDSDWAVSGEITITNTNPNNFASILDVSDLISPDIAALVDCGDPFPITVPAGGSLVCSYSSDLPDDSNRTNTATGTMQNYEYASDGTPTPGGTTDFNGQENVVFNAPSTKIDACTDVMDELPDGTIMPLGQACIEAELPAEFRIPIGPFKSPEDCGMNTLTNKAFQEEVDTGDETDDTWTINVLIEGGGVEICDGIDNDCDGLIDSDDPDVQGFIYYVDNDGDSYGAGPAVMFCASSAPMGYSVNNLDCDDRDGNLTAIGNPCDDENSTTIDDFVDGNCLCVGGRSIPTLSQWGIIALSMIMLILGLVFVRRKKVIFS